MNDVIRWCFKHNQLADEYSSLGCDPFDQSCDIGDMVPARASDTRLEAIADAWNTYMHQPSGYPSPAKWKTLADLLDKLTKEET